MGEVRVFRLPQRRGNTDADRIAAPQGLIIRVGLQLTLRDQRRQALIGYIADVAVAALDLRDSLGILFHTGYGETRLRKLHRQRQAHIAQTHDANACAAVAQSFVQTLSVALLRGDDAFLSQEDSQSEPYQYNARFRAKVARR